MRLAPVALLEPAKPVFVKRLRERLSAQFALHENLLVVVAGFVVFFYEPRGVAEGDEKRRVEVGRRKALGVVRVDVRLFVVPVFYGNPRKHERAAPRVGGVPKLVDGFGKGLFVHRRARLRKRDLRQRANFVLRLGYLFAPHDFGARESRGGRCRKPRHVEAAREFFAVEVRLRKNVRADGIGGLEALFQRSRPQRLRLFCFARIEQRVGVVPLCKRIRRVRLRKGREGAGKPSVFAVCRSVLCVLRGDFV